MRQSVVVLTVVVAIAAMLTLVFVMTTVGSKGGTTSVSAGVPPPSPTPCDNSEKPCWDGNLSGIFDLQFTNPLFTLTLFHCIARTDHDLNTNLIKSSLQCYADQLGVADPADVLADVNVPGEGPDFPMAGPPPPPPYTPFSPSKGLGFFDKTGTSPECVFYFPNAASCSVVLACFEDIGAGSFGPNVGVRFVIGDPKVNPSFGKVELNNGLSNADCTSLTMPPIGTNTALNFKSTRAAIGSVSWRTSATDFDGDGCSDFDELAKPGTQPKGCGDDPYNALDSNKSDLSGAYDILVRVLRSGGGTANSNGGIYFSCLADIQQTGDGKTDGDIVARTFCYLDSAVVVGSTTSEINKLAYPGVTGDGFPAGGPPWAAIPQQGAAAETDCSRGPFNANKGNNAVALDEDDDGVANDGCPSEGFADVDPKHTVLTGQLAGNENTILQLSGCFDDTDGSSSIGDVYVELAVNKNTGQGTVDIWREQTQADCDAGAPFGTYGTVTGQGEPAGNFNDAKTLIVRQPGGKLRDTDQDGIPNATELRDMDNPTSSSNNCGSRDPGNPYDWYDVNEDGVIDLLNDILGVIQHYAPGGAPPYDIDFDRPPAMTGGVGGWNRGEPDGVIDLLNDILGVIQQYHPGAC